MPDNPAPNVTEPTEPADVLPGVVEPPKVAPVPAPTPDPSTPVGDTPGSGINSEERAELERLRAIHADESKWEKRNKANLGKLRDLALEMGISREDFNPAEFDPKSELAKLRAEIESERVERTRVEIAAASGIPVELVQGSSREDMQANVDKLLNWQKASQPKLEKKQELPDAREVQGGREIRGQKKVSAAEYNAIADPEERRKLRASGLVEGFGPKGR